MRRGIVQISFNHLQNQLINKANTGNFVVLRNVHWDPIRETLNLIVEGADDDPRFQWTVAPYGEPPLIKIN